jgi:hypothetical protein
VFFGTLRSLRLSGPWRCVTSGATPSRKRRGCARPLHSAAPAGGSDLSNSSLNVRCVGAEIDDDIVIGAEAIAREVFGNQLNARQIYRLPEDNPPWPIVRVRGKLMCRRSVMRAHVARLEAEAVDRRPDNQEEKVS